MLAKGEGWAKLRTAIEGTKNEKWFRLARVPDSLPETPAGRKSQMGGTRKRDAVYFATVLVQDSGSGAAGEWRLGS